MTQEHLNQVAAAVNAVKAKGKINHFYLIACGGSKAFFGPAQYIFDMETEIPATIYSSNEFVHRMPKALGKDSVVLTCSHSGNTPETVKACELAREKGATTIAFSHLVDSPLWKAGEFDVHYNTKDEADDSNGHDAMLYAVVFGILNAIQPNEKYERAIKCVDNLPKLFAANKEKYAARAQEFGEKYKRATILYTMASGANYDVAYSFAICLMMEMQWINSSAIHSGEYFHGPFEITDYDVPFIIIKGLDECRPLDERAHAFCKKFSKEITLIDAEEFDMDGVCDDLKGYFCPLVAGVVLRDYADTLADHRGHPMSVRRYMWRMEY